MMGNARAGAMGSAMVGLLGLLAARSMAYSAAPVVGGGSVTGTIRYAGPVPSRGVLEVTKDQAVCGSTAKLANNLVVGPSGGLQYAVVSLRGVAAGKPFDGAPVTLDQRGCEYAPHVVIVPAGKDLSILNSDGVLHNIHTSSLRPDAAANPPVNRAQPKFKTSMTETFRAAETLRVSCDVHRWMQGWIVVVDHPYYAVTDAAGRFTLADVPPGDYQLDVWHETLGAITKPVSVAAGATSTVAAEMVPR
jgi:plastocyanin